MLALCWCCAGAVLVLCWCFAGGFISECSKRGRNLCAGAVLGGGGLARLVGWPRGLASWSGLVVWLWATSGLGLWASAHEPSHDAHAHTPKISDLLSDPIIALVRFSNFFALHKIYIVPKYSNSNFVPWSLR